MKYKKISEMNVATSGFLEPQRTFLNLSFLICNLFAGGHFKLVNILYHPHAFNDQFLVSIDSVCPFQIPKITQDISTNEIFPIERNQRTDNILQLIFQPIDQLMKHFDQIEKLITFYRIFIFTTSTQFDLEKINSIPSANLSTSSLILIYNDLNDALNTYIWSNSSIKSVELNDVRMNSNEMFNSVFSETASNRFLIASFFYDIKLCEYESNPNFLAFYVTRKWLRVIASIYFEQLNLSFVDRLVWNCYTKTVEHQRIRPIKRLFYNDAHFKYETMPGAEK